MNVSIVIPVYNEAEHLGACLRAIAAQTMKPYEVIVVDNNSQDDTVVIADRFPFVTVLHEKRQGVVHARTAGFNRATGDVIARIDADTLLPVSWVAQVRSIFTDKAVTAVSGKLHYHDIAASWGVDAVDNTMRQWMANRMVNYTFLVGSNMALRRSAWKTVRRHACHSGNLHEDLDLAVHLAEAGLRVIYEPLLVAAVSARRIDVNAYDLCRYMLLSPYTYARHKVTERRYMYPLIVIVFICYPLLRLLFRGYNTTEQRFSLSSLLTSETMVRPDPGIYH